MKNNLSQNFKSLDHTKDLVRKLKSKKVPIKNFDTQNNKSRKINKQHPWRHAIIVQAVLTPRWKRRVSVIS